MEKACSHISPNKFVAQEQCACFFSMFSFCYCRARQSRSQKKDLIVVASTYEQIKQTRCELEPMHSDAREKERQREIIRIGRRGRVNEIRQVLGRWRKIEREREKERESAKNEKKMRKRMNITVLSTRWRNCKQWQFI